MELLGNILSKTLDLTIERYKLEDLENMTPSAISGLSIDDELFFRCMETVEPTPLIQETQVEVNQAVSY